MAKPDPPSTPGPAKAQQVQQQLHRRAEARSNLTVKLGPTRSNSVKLAARRRGQLLVTDAYQGCLHVFDLGLSRRGAAAQLPSSYAGRMAALLDSGENADVKFLVGGLAFPMPGPCPRVRPLVSVAVLPHCMRKQKQSLPAADPAKPHAHEGTRFAFSGRAFPRPRAAARPAVPGPRTTARAPPLPGPAGGGRGGSGAPPHPEHPLRLL